MTVFEVFKKYVFLAEVGLVGLGGRQGPSRFLGHRFTALAGLRSTKKPAIR